MAEDGQNTDGAAGTDGKAPDDAQQRAVDDGKSYTAPASQADLDRIIEQRLARDRSKFADYDDLKKKAGEFDKLADAQKTETQRLTEERDTHKTAAESAQTDLLRLTVALDKAPDGTPISRIRTLAKRLHGSTQEELEADAEELFAEFAGTTRAGTGGKPKERLRGGGDPDKEPIEMDPAKLAAAVPRDAY